jgi:hypothetical protein
LAHQVWSAEQGYDQSNAIAQAAWCFHWMTSLNDKTCFTQIMGWLKVSRPFLYA